MKKNVFFFFFALCFAASTMYAESPDRKTVITNPKKVTISEENGKAIISVIEQKGDTSYDYKYEITSATPLSVSSTSDWDVNYPFKRDRDKDEDEFKTWETFVDGFYAGWGSSKVEGEALLQSKISTNEVGILNFFGVGYHPSHSTRISLGIGYNYRNYNLKKQNYFFKAGDVVEILPFGEEFNHRQSDLSIHSFQFPLLLNQRLGSKFNIELGPVMMWNFYADIDRKYKAVDTEYSELTNKLKQNPFHVEGFAALAWDDLGIYFRYNPNKVFKEGYGPEIKNTWTLGVMIGF